MAIVQPLTATEAERAMIDLENNPTLGKQDILEYRARERQIVRGFAAYLADSDFGNSAPASVTQAVFDRSWSDGHANGFSEVEHEYIQNAELVDMVIDALNK